MSGFTPRVDPLNIADLRDRLARARLPEQETHPDQGLALADVERLLRHWREDFDWDAWSERLTALPQVRAEIDGLGHHAVHVRSPRTDALPLLMGHGWPSTCFEFGEVAARLAEPETGPAFHVICPSLPGYGFSDRPTAPGWGAARTADAWVRLMADLGHDRFLVHGGDWGAIIGTELAVRHPERVRGLHLTMPAAPTTPADLDDQSPFERRGAARTEGFRRRGFAYAQVQRTRPQTIGYALVDSPVALLAWISEKLLEWSGRDEHGRPLLSDEAVLSVVSAYWLTGTGASAARMYAEALRHDISAPVRVPTGCSIFADEVVRTPRAAVARRFEDLRYWRELPRGGHFPAMEVPTALGAEIQAFAATLG